MTFWNSVFGFGPGIRFFLLGFDFKYYHVFALLDKSNYTIRLLIISYNLTERTSAHGQTGHVSY